MTTPTLTGVDIGSPRLPGTTTSAPGGVTIVSGGEDIWGTRDEGHFAQARIEGDFELRARVVSLEMADVYTKAGLMCRASLDAGAEHVFVLAFGDNQPRNKNNGGLEFQYRETAGGACTGVYPPQPLPAEPDFPVAFPDTWLSLARRGDVFSARASRDGIGWKTFCEHRQPLPSAVYVGLGVTSHNTDQRVTAIFSEVELLG